MGVRVSGRGLSVKQRPVLDEVRALAPRALSLVEGYMGRSAGRVEVMVMDLGCSHDLLVAVHQELLGTRNLPTHRWEHGAVFGHTTFSASESLVLLDAVRLARQPGELPPTVVHEFAHAVQFARPGARELAVRYLGDDYGLIRIGRREVRKANRETARDEQEARDMEFLADQLVKEVA
ncbi:hypothetical protein OG897_13485 [Streptomyces sp. NBC_00237]|uniref:hypothetical protein n=1 Tax=Streptomyces sp. NBC_00237 TaxID=2975687 RepID=UPI00225A6FC1|nr:hypothetical protein [Streptomyces sp. NBC_00237]MCX5202456.1 hypothetical protein [Streptomyces sp. NBC_00237]